MDEGVVFAMGDDLATGERTFVATYEEAVIARGTAGEMEEALKPLAGKRGKGLKNEIKQFQLLKKLQQIDNAIKELGIEIIIGYTKAQIMQALKNDFSDFEYAIPYTSALYIAGLNAIIARNIKDYSKLSIAVMTP